MYQLVEKQLNLEFPLDHHLHCMVCQLPVNLGGTEAGCQMEETNQAWDQVRSVLDLVADGEGNLKRLHFLILPEASMPAERVDDALELIRQRFHPNTVTMFGVEHVALTDYLEMLRRYSADNDEALQAVQEDLDSGDISGIPVNWAVIAVKEADGNFRVFLQAKRHPFFGEESLDYLHDLYRGKIFPWFRCTPVCFNFTAMICFDYVYRDLYQSNISSVVHKANQLFHQTRQRLDLLAVLECNPKPEHRAFRDVLNGFYGEYLEYNPGVKDAVSVFCNASEETRIAGLEGDYSYGHSSVSIHQTHRIGLQQLAEYATDDFGGLPICRLRFGTKTRLYYFNLPLFHELDPRTTRVPLKIHSVFVPTDDGTWTRMTEDSTSSTMATLNP